MNKYDGCFSISCFWSEKSTVNILIVNWYFKFFHKIAGSRGFEPRSELLESPILPLNYDPKTKFFSPHIIPDMVFLYPYGEDKSVIFLARFNALHNFKA